MASLFKKGRKEDRKLSPSIYLSFLLISKFPFFSLGLVTSQATRLGSGSARKKLGSGSARKKLSSGLARELNEPSLSLNLGLINLGLGSSSLEKSSAQATGTHMSLELGFRLRSPAGRIWSSPVRSRLRHAEVKCPGHVSQISM